MNTRRLAERVAHLLAERLGEEHVAAHHGSLSQGAPRCASKQRLRDGELRRSWRPRRSSSASTSARSSSCARSARRAASRRFLQRVGRSGHSRFGDAARAAVPAHARRARRVRRAAARACARAGSTRSRCPRRRSTSSRSRSSPSARPRSGTRTSCSSSCGAPRRTRRCRAPTSTRSLELVSRGRRRPGAAGARRYLHRDRVNGRLQRRAAARGWPRSPRAARSRRSPTTAWSPTRTTRSSARSTKTSRSRAWRATSSCSAAPRGASGASSAASCASSTREGATPTDPVLARRSAGAHAASCRDEVSRAARATIDARLARGRRRRRGDAWLATERGARREAVARRARRATSPRSARRARRRCRRSGHRLRALLRRDRRHAARRARAVRRAHQPRARAALRKRFCTLVRLRAAGGGERRRHRALARAAAQLPARGRCRASCAPQSVARRARSRPCSPTPMFGVRWRWNLNRALVVLRFGGGKKNPPPFSAWSPTT